MRYQMMPEEGVYLSGSSRGYSWQLEREKTTPWWQTAIKCLIVLVFIASVCDRGFWTRNMEAYKEKALFADSAEGQALLAEIPEIIAEISEKGSSGILTPEDGASAQWRVMEICSKTNHDWSKETTFIYNCAKECFINHWEPSDEFPEYYQELFRKRPEKKMEHASMIFSQKFIEAQGDTRGEYFPTLGKEHLIALLSWLSRWYLLMMIPSFLIVLVSYKFAKLKVKEELLINPKDIVIRTLFWPFGIAVSFETPAKAKRYAELEGQYVSETGKNYYELTSDDKSAIWLKVMQPVLRFDQALIMVKQSEVRIRRPLAVCAIAWMMGILANHVRHIDLIKSSCISIVQPLQEMDSGDNMKGGKKNSPPTLLAIVPSTLELPVTRIVECHVPEVRMKKKHQLAPYRPRGPPAVRESDGNIICLSPDCHKQKRRET